MSNILKFPSAVVSALRASTRAAGLEHAGQTISSPVDAARDAGRDAFEYAEAGGEAARAAVDQARKNVAWLEKERAAVARHRAATTPSWVVISNEREVRLPFLLRLRAPLLMVLALVGIALGNWIGAQYLVASGSDLFADGLFNAAAFMGVALLAGGAFKAFEIWLPTHTAKVRFQYVIFGVGSISFLVWSAMMALTFAPQAADSTAWLTEAGSGHAETSLLLLCHLLCDAFFSFVIFSGAEALALSGHKRVVLTNPLHVQLTAQLAQLDEQIEAAVAEAGEALGALKRYEAGVRKAQHDAERAHRMAVEGEKLAVEAAAAEARLKFINLK